MRERYKSAYRGLHVKYLSFLSDFIENQIFLSNSGKILQHYIWLKSAQWEPCCSMRADRQTDRQTDTTELFVFRNFEKAPKMMISFHSIF